MTKVSNNWLSPVPGETLKGNNSTSTGQPKDLTKTEILNMLDISSSTQIWCGPVVETPSNTLYADVELPEMVFEYNQYNRLDSVFEAEV